MIIFVFLATASLVAKAQIDTTRIDIPMKDGKIFYEGIVETPNLTKVDLYNNAKQWFVDYFKSSKDVIQNEDKDQGRIVGKGIIFISRKDNGSKGDYNDEITIQVDVKDGKYRYRIYNMTIIREVSYNALTGQNPYIQFFAEDLINKLYNNGKLFLSKTQCRVVLQSMDVETTATIASLEKAMKKRDNF